MFDRKQCCSTQRRSPRLDERARPCYDFGDGGAVGASHGIDVANGPFPAGVPPGTASPVCGAIPGKGVLKVVGIGVMGVFTAIVGVGIRPDGSLETFGVGSDAVAGRGTGPPSLDEFGTGIEPSVTLSNGASVAEPDGLSWLEIVERPNTALGELPEATVAAGLCNCAVDNVRLLGGFPPRDVVD